MNEWQLLLEKTVTACGNVVPILSPEGTQPAYAEALATFGAGTFDDALTLLPPEHTQTWASRMEGLIEEGEMPSRLRDLVIFAEDIDGRMLAAGKEGGLVRIDGFDAIEETSLREAFERILRFDGRRSSWFRRYGKYVLAHAEALLPGADASMDAWVNVLLESDDTRLLASVEGQARIRELHLPVLDGVLRLQSVGPRCSLRLHLPRTADAKAALSALHAPASWSPLVESARTTIVGVDR